MTLPTPTCCVRCLSTPNEQPAGTWTLTVEHIPVRGRIGDPSSKVTGFARGCPDFWVCPRCMAHERSKKVVA